MIKEKHIQFVISTFLIIYFAQGVLYPSGSIISQTALLVILLISSMYMIKSFLMRGNKNLFYIVWTALLLLNVVSFVFTGKLSNPHHFGMFKGVLISLLTFYPFFYFAQKNILISKHLVWFFIAMLPIAILQFFFNKEQILLERIGGNEDLVNNAAYGFVNLIPFLFLIKKNKILPLIGMLVLIFFIIQGAKRGAIVVGGVGLLVFVYYQLRTVEKKYRVRGYLFAFIGIVIVSYFTYNLYFENEFLIHRMQLMLEGDSSARDRIFDKIFYGWYNSDNILNFLFGFGFAGSQKLAAGSFAHNDWLELLSNFGLLGVSIYLILFYSAYKYIRNSYWDTDKKILMFAVVSMWFLITLFSMGYTSNGGYSRAIILAYLVGNKKSGLI